jgi:hypothetical protein
MTLQPFQQGIELAYFNTNGMNRAKLDNIECMVTSKECHIIVVVEHWFIHEVETQQSALYVQHFMSPKPLMNGWQRQCHKGLVIFTHTTLQRFIEVTTLAKNYLIFRLGDLTIKAFYLAPSLPDGVIATTLTWHMTSVATPLWPSVGVKPNTSKVGIWSPLGLPNV